MEAEGEGEGAGEAEGEGEEDDGEGDDLGDEGDDETAPGEVAKNASSVCAQGVLPTRVKINTSEESQRLSSPLIWQTMQR